MFRGAGFKHYAVSGTWIRGSGAEGLGFRALHFFALEG